MPQEALSRATLQSDVARLCLVDQSGGSEVSTHQRFGLGFRGSLIKMIGTTLLYALLRSAGEPR